jgi:HSP20 family molecular chaperone IbpA
MVLNQTLGLNSLRQDLNRLFYAAPIAGQAFAQGFAANSLYAPGSFFGGQPWPTSAVSLQAAAIQQAAQQPMMAQPVHFVPRVNAAETHEAVFYCVELPGVEISQVALSIHGNVLVLEGVRQPGGLIGDRMISYQHAEGRFGAFRWVGPIPNGTMPAGIDCTLRNGLLTIVLPKAGAQFVASPLASQTTIVPGFAGQGGIAPAPVAQIVINQAPNA